MIGLNRILRLCALAALLAGCKDLPAVLEDVGADPHPPRLTVLGIGVQLPSSDPEVPPPTPDYVPPEAGLTVHPFDATANTLAIRFSYADVAADLDSVVVRDLDGSISYTGTFTGFPGTAGIAEIKDLAIPETVQGPHTLEVWAEDLNGSRSEKTTFTITVELF